MKKIVVIIVLFSVLVSCKTQKVSHDTIVYDAIYKNRIEKVLDSVFIDRYNTIREAGDTIFVLDSVTVLRWRDRLLRDTLYQTSDSIVIRNTVQEVEVVPTYYKVTSWIMWILVVLALCYVVFRVIKWYLKR